MKTITQIAKKLNMKRQLARYYVIKYFDYVKTNYVILVTDNKKNESLIKKYRRK